MPRGDRAENLAKAAAAYEAALAVRTRAAASFQWAMTRAEQANLPGIPLADRWNLLRRAIAAGKGALEVHTPQASPQEHAETSHNLAIDRRRYEELGGHAGPDGVLFDDIQPAQ